ncbi:hypothetical protein [Nocardia rhizosphaerae]|uniref:Uncharacterized protein n=1 Tax=Nocardia rhizosphaerae TaxID=1691571 RepID=A0ABV8L949_9NOCA
MDDGTEHEHLPTIVADQQLYASTRRRQKWDGPADDPITFQNFVGYAVLRRLDLFDGDFTAFCERAVSVVFEEDEPVDPTNPAPSND